MTKDKIVEEVRKARERYAARFGFDLDAIYRDLCDRQERGEFHVVHRPPRRPHHVGAESSTVMQSSRAKVARR